MFDVRENQRLPAMGLWCVEVRDVLLELLHLLAEGLVAPVACSGYVGKGFVRDDGRRDEPPLANGLLLSHQLVFKFIEDRSAFPRDFLLLG